MKRKIILATTFIVFLSLIVYFYLKSNNSSDLIEKKQDTNIVKKENIEKLDEIIESSNIIEDVSYSAKDTGGNEYFLKASERTSMPLFEDPRPGNMMNLLPEKDKTKVTYASSQINYMAKPGRVMFFPSYMPHQYIVDMGYEPFRFIHWNCQAIPKGVLNAK